MNKKKCPVCSSVHTVKNGRPNGVQTYMCQECHYRFRSVRQLDEKEIWTKYQEGKQTIGELAETFQTSSSTIKRILRGITRTWEQPPLCGGGFVHLDATYWGRGFGCLLALDDETGRPLYLAFIRSEKVADYTAAVESIRRRGFLIKGLIVDGKKTLFSTFKEYRIQMCQFHMRQIVRRYLTKNPRLKAAVGLNDLMRRLTASRKEEFTMSYNKWKEEWSDTLTHRSTLSSGKTQYTHRRLRSAMHSLDFFLPYLFTCQEKGCEGMPNTNNKIEGTFTDLKKNLNNHSGMTEVNRKRFISGFFLALDDAHSIRKRETSE